MKKNGFIATSLIYSFFLIFITLFLTIIADYLQQKVLLNEIEKGIKDNINDSMGIRDFEVGDILSQSSLISGDDDIWIVARVEVDNNTLNGDNSSLYLYSYELKTTVNESEDQKILTLDLVTEDLQLGGVYNNTYLNKLIYFFDGENFNLSNSEIKKDTNCISLNEELNIVNSCNTITTTNYRIRKKITIGKKRFNKELSPDGSITITGELS